MQGESLQFLTPQAQPKGSTISEITGRAITSRSLKI